MTLPCSPIKTVRHGNQLNPKVTDQFLRCFQVAPLHPYLSQAYTLTNIHRLVRCFLSQQVLQVKIQTNFSWDFWKGSSKVLTSGKQRQLHRTCLQRIRPQEQTSLLVSKSPSYLYKEDKERFLHHAGSIAELNVPKEVIREVDALKILSRARSPVFKNVYPYHNEIFNKR